MCQCGTHKPWAAPAGLAWPPTSPKQATRRRFCNLKTAPLRACFRACRWQTKGPRGTWPRVGPHHVPMWRPQALGSTCGPCLAAHKPKTGNKAVFLQPENGTPRACFRACRWQTKAPGARGPGWGHIMCQCGAHKPWAAPAGLAWPPRSPTQAKSRRFCNLKTTPPGLVPGPAGSKPRLSLIHI